MSVYCSSSKKKEWFLCDVVGALFSLSSFFLLFCSLGGGVWRILQVTSRCVKDYFALANRNDFCWLRISARTMGTCQNVCFGPWQTLHFLCIVNITIHFYWEVKRAFLLVIYDHNTSSGSRNRCKKRTPWTRENVGSLCAYASMKECRCIQRYLVDSLDVTNTTDIPMKTWKRCTDAIFRSCLIWFPKKDDQQRKSALQSPRDLIQETEEWCDIDTTLRPRISQ